MMILKKLLNRLIQLRHEMSWILAGQALGFAGGFIGIKVMTNVMSPENYGQLALGLTIAGILTTYIYGPVANVVARFFAVYRERDDLKVYFVVLKRWHRLLAVILLVLALIVAGFICLYAGSEWGLIVLLSSLFGIVGGINASYLSLQSAIRQRKVVALHQGADVWLRIGFSVTLLWFWNNSGYFALLGFLCGTLLITGSQHFFAMRNTEIERYWHDATIEADALDKSNREFIAYATPFVVFAGFAIISLYADRWIIQWICGERMVGVYAAIFQIASSPVNLLFALLNQLMVPIIFERAGAMTSEVQAKESAALMQQTALFAAAASLPGLVVAFFFSEPIVRVFTNRTFAENHSILWLEVLGLTLYNVGQIFCLKGMYCNRPKMYFWPKAVYAGALLLLGFLLTRQYGMLGMTGALCLSSVIYVLAVLVANYYCEWNSETEFGNKHK